MLFRSGAEPSRSGAELSRSGAEPSRKCLLRLTNVTDLRANGPPPPRTIIKKNFVRGNKVQGTPAVRRMLGPRVVVMWLKRGTGPTNN